MEDNEIVRIYAKAYEYLNSCNIYEVRNLARAFGFAPMIEKKHELMLRIIRVAAGLTEPERRSNRGARVKASDASAESVAKVRAMVEEGNQSLTYGDEKEDPVGMLFRDVENTEQEYGYGDECIVGILEIVEKGYGCVRSMSCEASKDDLVISEKAIRESHLREGDVVSCYVQREDGVTKTAKLAAVNGAPPAMIERRKFDEIPAIYPYERFELGREDCPFLRLVDIVCPVCKGQRGILIAPPCSGKTAFLREAASSFSKKYPQTRLILVLLDQRPEEITEMQDLFPEAVFVSSCFDRPPVRAAQSALLALEHAKRVAEEGGDAIILLDSFTSLVRAFAGESSAESGNKSVNSGEDFAIGKVKKYFSAARNLKNAGSITLLATAVVGATAVSAVLNEELKGAANMVVAFSREIARRGTIPAIDYSRSFTKRTEAIQTEEEIICARALKAIAAREKGTEQVLHLIRQTDTNEEFIRREELWKNA